jgi:hypothetical protein
MRSIPIALIVFSYLFALSAANSHSGFAFAQTAAGSSYANATVPSSALVPAPPTFSGPSAGGFFSIVNARDAKVSRAEAEKIYLTVCQLLERQLDRSNEIRPRFKLILGGNHNVLNFRKREIRLEKWDRYRFAEGVIELALDNMMPTEEKNRLRDLAVTEAKGTVNLCELTTCTN